MPIDSVGRITPAFPWLVAFRWEYQISTYSMIYFDDNGTTVCSMLGI